MQTFLPYPDYQKSAQVLDNKRLGKQRVEAWQILRTIGKQERAKGWRNHPAVNMWRGYEIELCEYGLAMCDEWVRRGFKDSLRRKFEVALFMLSMNLKHKKPKWLGDERLHLSHQSNLIRKDPEYKLLFPNAPENLAYFWVSKEEEYINA